MKKRGAFLLILLLLVTPVFARTGDRIEDDREVVIAAARVSDYVFAGDYADIFVSIDNDSRHFLNQVEVRAYPLDFDTFAVTQPFLLNRRNIHNARLELYIPPDTQTGIYTLRIVIGNDEFERIIHRDFIVLS